MADAYFTGLWIGQKAAVVVVVYAVDIVIIIILTLRLLRIIGALPVFCEGNGGFETQENVTRGQFFV